MRQVEKRTGIIARFAACFRDHRNPERIEHSVQELVAQRVYALSLGREVSNDHDQLRADPLLAVLLEEVRRLVGQIREKWPGVKITLRGDMENRVKKQLSLFADPTSTAFLRSNQVRRCAGFNPQVAANY
jgi:hypothetical protein